MFDLIVVGALLVGLVRSARARFVSGVAAALPAIVHFVTAAVIVLSRTPTGRFEFFLALFFLGPTSLGGLQEGRLAIVAHPASAPSTCVVLSAIATAAAIASGRRFHPGLMQARRFQRIATAFVAAGSLAAIRIVAWLLFASSSLQ